MENKDSDSETIPTIDTEIPENVSTEVQPFIPPPGGKPDTPQPSGADNAKPDNVKPDTSKPDTKSNESTKSKKSYPWLWWIIVILAITLFTLVASLFIVTKSLKGYAKPVVVNKPIAGSSYIQTIFNPTTTDRDNVPLSLLQIIAEVENAQSSVYLAAERITTIKLLEALVRAHKRGVKVVVLVDNTSNSANDYLKREGLSYIFMSKLQLNSHFIIIDKTKVILSSGPFTTKMGATTMSHFDIITDPTIAATYITKLSEWAKLQ